MLIEYKIIRKSPEELLAETMVEEIREEIDKEVLSHVIYGHGKNESTIQIGEI